MVFYIGFYAYAIIVHTQADQLLPQLLMEQFDTFPIQCRHTDYMHEGVYALMVPSWADQLLPQFLWNNLILCLYNVDTLNICKKQFGPEKYLLTK